MTNLFYTKKTNGLTLGAAFVGTSWDSLEGAQNALIQEIQYRTRLVHQNAVTSHEQENRKKQDRLVRLLVIIAVVLVAAFIYARSTTPQNAPPKTASEAIARVKEYLLGNEGNKRYPGWTAAGLEHYNWSAKEDTKYWSVDASSAIRLGNGPSGERTYFWALEKNTGYVFLSLYCDTSGLTMREVCIP